MEGDSIRQALRNLADENVAWVSRRFFKSNRGQYGEGDVFLGIRVPQLRKLERTFRHVELPTVTGLLTSPIHEERLLALLPPSDTPVQPRQPQRTGGNLLLLQHPTFNKVLGLIPNWGSVLTVLLCTNDMVIIR